jgi:predicted aldo/keto reductase-like oxidoreductase
MSKSEISRRKFLADSAKVAAGAAVVSAMPSILRGQGKAPESKPAAKEHEGPDVLTPRKLGRVGIVVPVGGYGTLANTSPQIAAKVFDSGFHFVHSCAGYNGGKSYAALAEVFKDKKRREKLVLALKVDGRGLDRDLKTLGVDHADIIVPPKESANALTNERFIQDAQAAKKAGKVRAIGWASHSGTTETLNAAAELKDVFDVALIGYRNSDKPEFINALKAAKAAGIGIFAMKFGTRPDKPEKLQERMKWLVEKGHADSVLLSFSRESQVEPVLKLELGKMTTAEKAALRFERAQLAASECTWCGRCADGEGRCPNGVAIPQIMRYDYYRDRGWMERATGKYAAVAVAGCSADACTNCGACEKACPARLPVRKMLRDVHGRLA